ncbi:triose-phosphate isomerase [Streptococcus thoraltensis]|uniref:triose-phosphate isomerase n=1 Tax=Streptococcus thoraltensis TaxID=55085 RepID=UPI000382E9B7|nr:triose-phosphate isomerase [Streptococcus thoraltensis]MDY4760824.1 triose-phosphate isomerase [Streptococcus thoraltensis]
MSKVEVKTPFFIFNPKSYLYGDDIVEMAEVAEEMAQAHPEASVFITCPFADISRVVAVTDKAFVSAQHLDGIVPGRGMGHILPESLKAAGVQASFINHAEHPLTFSELVKAVERANELDIVTVVCADSLKEARAIASLEPDIILCEPTELIGTGNTSDEAYITSTNEAIKAVSPNTLVMQAAGISSADDVYNVIKLGADGTGCTSGITEASNSKQMLRDMVEAAVKASRV